jgi:hypothetical protein
MTREELQKALDATLLLECGSMPEEHYDTVCACDMMSELLTMMNQTDLYRGGGVILVTGLINPQVIRTSEMVDIRLIVFLRDKKPSQETLDLALKCGITIMSTPHTMFKSCGLLYNRKLRDTQQQPATI